jgi:hypothetical protein
MKGSKRPVNEKRESLLSDEISPLAHLRHNHAAELHLNTTLRTAHAREPLLGGAHMSDLEPSRLLSP